MFKNIPIELVHFVRLSVHFVRPWCSPFRQTNTWVLMVRWRTYPMLIPCIKACLEFSVAKSRWECRRCSTTSFSITRKFEKQSNERPLQHLYCLVGCGSLISVGTLHFCDPVQSRTFLRINIPRNRFLIPDLLVCHRETDSNGSDSWRKLMKTYTWVVKTTQYIFECWTHERFPGKKSKSRSCTPFV